MEIPFPISIGVAGAPGSGKSPLIDEFLKISDPWFASYGQRIESVPNPGHVIEDEYNQAMGNFGSYVEDLWAFFQRYESEQAVLKRGNSFVSSGTICDSIAHCGVNLENIVMGIATPETQVRYKKNQVAMTTLSLLFRDRFRYTFGFYLPYRGSSLVVPGMDNTENNYGQRVDQALKFVFQNFGLPIQPLAEPTLEENAQVMFQTVKEIMENGPQEPEADEESESVDLIEQALLSEGEEIPTPDADTLAE